MIFEPNTELSINTNHGFIRKAHTFGQFNFVSLDKIGRLMHVQAKAVARSVR